MRDVEVGRHLRIMDRKEAVARGASMRRAALSEMLGRKKNRRGGP